MQQYIIHHISQVVEVRVKWQACCFPPPFRLVECLTSALLTWPLFQGSAISEVKEVFQPGHLLMNLFFSQDFFFLSSFGIREN